MDTTSLTFGRTGDEPSLASCKKRGIDVNRDGLVDLVCYFKRHRTGLAPGDTEAVLKGQSRDGTPIEGRAPVRIRGLVATRTKAAKLNSSLAIRTDVAAAIDQILKDRFEA